MRFHADLPVGAEAVGGHKEIGSALHKVGEAVERGPIALTGVEIYGPRDL